MKDPLDQFWNSVLAADAASVEEMARAEASLRLLEPQPRLPQEQIDAMVRAAVKATETTATVAPATPILVMRSHRRRLLATAAILFVSMSVAWIVFEPLWREGTRAKFTMDYALACRVAYEPNQPEEDRLEALGIIDDHFGLTIPALQRLCGENTAEPLRSQARSIRDRLRWLLREGADRAPKPVDIRRAEVTNRALDDQLAVEERQAALAHLGYLCEEGMRAFLKVTLSTTEGRLKWDFLKTRFAKELAL